MFEKGQLEGQKLLVRITSILEILILRSSFSVSQSFLSSQGSSSYPVALLKHPLNRPLPPNLPFIASRGIVQLADGEFHLYENLG